MGDAVDLDTIEARADAATPGPWTLDIGDRASTGSAHYFVRTVADHPRMDGAGPPCPRSVAWLCGGLGESRYRRVITAEDYRRDPGIEADARFLAHARADVPALVAEVRRLRAAIARWVACDDATMGTPEAAEIDAAETALVVIARDAGAAVAGTHAATLARHDAIRADRDALARIVRAVAAEGPGHDDCAANCAFRRAAEWCAAHPEGSEGR